jgi:hypothetical protein
LNFYEVDGSGNPDGIQSSHAEKELLAKYKADLEILENEKVECGIES